MKPRRYWINRLPEPVAHRAVNNLRSYCKTQGLDWKKILHEKCNSGQAIIGAFDFESSPERGEYWFNVNRIVTVMTEI